MKTKEPPQYNCIDLFPTLIWVINLDWKFNKQEKKVFTDSLKDPRINQLGNLTSKDTYILDKKPLQDFKQEILIHITNYFNYVWKPKDDITPYITQSWTNLTKKDMYFNAHSHSNSWVSAVYYYKTDKELDRIKFGKPFNEYAPLSVEPTSWETYNALSWDVKVKQGDLVIFPSTLKHSVPEKEHEGERISLAINSFLKGTLGGTLTLNELKL